MSLMRFKEFSCRWIEGFRDFRFRFFREGYGYFLGIYVFIFRNIGSCFRSEESVRFGSFLRVLDWTLKLYKICVL